MLNTSVCHTFCLLFNKKEQAIMRFTTTLPALAAMVPTIMAAQAYLPYAWKPDVERIHNRPVNAVDGRFYINKGTTFVPPPGASASDNYNHTIIKGPIGNDS